MNRNRRIALQGGWQSWTRPEQRLYPVFQKINFNEAAKFKKLIIRYGAKNDVESKTLKSTGLNPNSNEYSNLVNYFKNIYYIKYKNTHINFNFNDENLEINISLVKEFFNNMSPFNKTLNNMGTSYSTNEVTILLNQRVAFSYIKLGGGLDRYVMGGVVNYLLCPENDFMFNNIIDIDSSLYPKYLNEYSNVLYWILNDFLIRVGLKQGIVTLFNDLNINNEILKKEREEKKRREEEQRKREEAIKKVNEEKERITKEKNIIKYELETYLNNIDKNNYYEKEYTIIIDLINNYILELPSLSNYKDKYDLLLKKIKRVKTKNYYTKLKKFKSLSIIFSTCILAVLIIYITLHFWLIPEYKYNKAIQLFYNNDIVNSYDILKELDYKDAVALEEECELLIELIEKTSEMDTFQLKNIENELKNLRKINYELDFDYGNDNFILVDHYIIYGFYQSAKKDGYRFEKWIFENLEYNTNNKEIKIYLSPVFDLNEYSIKYNLYGGKFTESVVETYNVNSNDIFIPNPIKEGYKFLGWTTDKIKEPTINLVIKSGTYENVSLYANWEVITYIISFNSNGGMEVNDLPVYYDHQYVLPQCFREGYIFLGWCYDDEKVATKGDYKFLTNIELIANWELVEYTISYDLNGGYAYNPLVYNVNTQTFSLNDPLREGYNFIKWIDKDGNDLFDGAMVSKGTVGDLRFSAIWEPIEYNIIYHLYSGINDENNLTTFTIEDNILLYTPSKKGYDFYGWFINENFETEIQEIKVGTIDDINLYAKFVPKTYNITVKQESFNVIFFMNDGTTNIFDEQIMTVGMNINYPDIPIRSGYCFTGWYTESECNNFYYFTETVKHDLLLYAGWEETNDYKVTDGRDLTLLIDNYWTPQTRKGITYAFCNLDGGSISLSFENDHNYHRTIVIRNKTKNIDIYEKEIDWFDGVQHVTFESDQGDIITVYSYSNFILTETPLTVSGIMTPLCSGEVYNTYAEYTVNYDSSFAIYTRFLDGYTFNGYFDQNGNQITDSNGVCLKPFGYDYDLILSESWTKQEK